MCCIGDSLKYSMKRNFPSSGRDQEEGELWMDDEEVRKLLRRTDREFRALYRRMRKFRESRSDFIFTRKEERAWSKAEPDFPKPIAKPFAIRRYLPKTRQRL
jgi:hypothetical protein